MPPNSALNTLYYLLIWCIKTTLKVMSRREERKDESTSRRSYDSRKGSRHYEDSRSGDGHDRHDRYRNDRYDRYDDERHDRGDRYDRDRHRPDDRSDEVSHDIGEDSKAEVEFDEFGRVVDKTRVVSEEQSELEQMQSMMGFGGFSSTKGEKVIDNILGAAKGAVSVNKTREYRQYMNRKGGHTYLHAVKPKAKTMK